jgi:gluconate 5-dehydrogenase
LTAGKALFSLDGRVALITGGSRGLGLAMAEGLGQAGATVAINGRSADTLETVASTLRGRGLEAETSPFDVTDHHAAQSGLGHLDVNAGPSVETASVLVF